MPAVARSASRAGPKLDHLRAMMVPAGIIQFSIGRTPDTASGTCLDDNARAWLVAMHALTLDPEYPHAREAGDRALGFLIRAQRPDGKFHNLADVRGVFIDDVGSQDSIGRAMWACGIAARCAAVPEWRDAAIARLDAALPVIELLTANHARAYCVLGLSAALAPEAASPLRPCGNPLPSPLRNRLYGALKTVCDALDDEFRMAASDDWRWWSDRLTWGNSRLPEAMLRAAAATGNRHYAETGLRSFEFLAGITQSNELFVPIGNDGWYSRGGARAKYDQQPIEACAMVDAWIAVYKLTGERSHLDRARTAFEWFNGVNSERIAVAIPETGGCYDGLRPGDVNRNQGAESTLSYLHAEFAIDAV
jgi:hypothetical protein